MILFIHQLGGTRSLWLPQIRGILGLSDSYTDKQLLDLFTLSLPGHPDNDEPFDFKHTRELINSFVEEKFAKQEDLAKKMVLTNRPEIIKAMKSPKLMIVGHELGGAIALDYTLENLAKVNRLVLVGCGAYFNQFSLKIRDLYYHRLGKLDLSVLRKRYGKAKEPRKKNFLFIFAENTNRQALDSGLQLLKKFAFQKSFQTLTLDEQLQMTKLPILLIRGSKDWLCPQASVAKLQDALNPEKEIWQRKKSVINLGKLESNVIIKNYTKAGANPMDQDPVSFVYDVRQFLKQ
jgi:pimeloyl-ACP methyl ester carboxylesterase